MKREDVEDYLDKIRKIRKEEISTTNDFISDIIRESDFYDFADIKYQDRLEEILESIDKPGHDKKINGVCRRIPDRKIIKFSK